MLGTLIIVFREVIEAGLIIGIVLAATRGLPGRGAWVGFGVVGGIAGACMVAAFAGVIADAFAGTGQELFNVAVLAVAVAMLGWHNVWMARHGSMMAAEMRAVGESVAAGRRSLAALAIVVGIAVLREGSEVVLFLYGILAQGDSTALAMVFGGALGLALGAILAALMYLGLLRIPSRHLFSTTSFLIALLAAGMAAQAVAFLQQAGFVTILENTVWDTSGLLRQSSVLGRMLHTLVGYSDRPSQLQLFVYVATLAAIVVMSRKFGAASRRPAVA